MTKKGREREQSPREIIRAWVRAEIASKDEISMPALRDQALVHFGNNYAFMGSIARMSLNEILYRVVQSEVARGRVAVVDEDEPETLERVEERAERFASRFLTWFEHTGEKSVRLMEATREDLLQMAAVRRRRGDHELQIADLWERIADGLEGDQRVSERFTAEEIEAMYRSLDTAA